MTDWEDLEEDMFVGAMSTNGWLSLVFLAAMVACAIAYSSQTDDCATHHCDNGAPSVVKGECVCLERAR